MRRKILWSLSGLLTFVVGIGAAWMFYYSSPKPTLIEKPPCRSCARVYDSTSSSLPVISFCELASDPHRYNTQVVRVRAYVKHDSGYFFLRDLNNQDNCGYADIEFDSSMVACDGVQKAFDDLLGYKHRSWQYPAGFDGGAGAVLVGRLEENGARGSSRFRFVVMCVEEAFTVYPDN